MLYNTKNPHGGDLYSQPTQIDFSANINPYGTPEAVRRAVADAAGRLLHYPDPYCRELVTAIAAHEGVPQDYILCGNGAAELIFSYCAALRPRRALLCAPTFSEYATALETVGCEIQQYYLKETQDFSLNGEFLEYLRTWQGDALLLCNPNNPTGQVIGRPLLEEIGSLCTQKNIALFVDECFLDLTEGGAALSLKERLAQWPHLFLLKAFTKSYGMAGLRLGYCLCGNARLLEAMGRTVQPWNVSIPAQLAGVAALGEAEFLERANRTIREQRAFLTERLRALGLRVIPSRANYILFHSERELKQPLLARGILIRSCANYPGLSQGWYRVAVKLPEQNQALIGALEAILHG